MPVVTLTILGVLICVLGLFAAGDLVIAGVGLAAVATAGILEVVSQISADRAAGARDRQASDRTEPGSSNAPQAHS